MRVYISGAVTGTDDYKERFSEAEAILTEIGYEVVNPVKEMEKFVDSSWDAIMGRCLSLLDTCNGIHLLNGWKESRGACMEFGYALGRGIMPIRGIDIYVEKNRNLSSN